MEWGGLNVLPMTPIDDAVNHQTRKFFFILKIYVLFFVVRLGQQRMEKMCSGKVDIVIIIIYLFCFSIFQWFVEKHFVVVLKMGGFS
jgi:hypothetical protein